MITDIEKLIYFCEDELCDRGYNKSHHKKISAEWNKLKRWVKNKKIQNFNNKVGFTYCDLTFGGHIISEISRKDMIPLRAIRMLISYQLDGDFEFRTPSIEQNFAGETSDFMIEYLTYLSEVKKIKKNTISNKKRYLYALNQFFEKYNFTFEDVDLDVITNFYIEKQYTLASKHNCNSTLKLFFQYLYDNKIIENDLSIYILSDNYRKLNKLPSIYEESEIKKMISAVDRASKIGKRDYLILLLASEYGWRSSDIVNFKFQHIDWDRNIISFNQVKTDTLLEQPLLSSVGNAIIDYLKFGRPKSVTKEIIVSIGSPNIGKKMCTTTIHSIVTKYMRLANIKNWELRRHGPHALRHSLASNLLKKNVSLPTISAVLGHGNTESTKIYLKVDENNLKKCVIALPELKSKYYLEVEY